MGFGLIFVVVGLWLLNDWFKGFRVEHNVSDNQILIWSAVIIVILIVIGVIITLSR